MIKQIYKEEGVGGFFKGVIMAVVLTVNPIISFVIYETLKKKFGAENISGLYIILISLISKLVATIFTYPLLTFKTLFQANEKHSNNELLRILSDIFKKEGIYGFYKGIISLLRPDYEDCPDFDK
jgi:hypothetical protein